jgi:hypothetical protein
VHFIELILLGVRLGKAKRSGERTNPSPAAKQSEFAAPFLNHVLGKFRHASPQGVEGDITTIGASPLSTECHSGNPHKSFAKTGRMSPAIQSSLSAPRNFQQS